MSSSTPLRRWIAPSSGRIVSRAVRTTRTELKEQKVEEKKKIEETWQREKREEL